jgi:hypothetical protein
MLLPLVNLNKETSDEGVRRYLFNFLRGPSAWQYLRPALP